MYKLPEHPLFKDGYVLQRRPQPLETPAPAYGPGKVFLSEYDVVRELKPRSQRQLGRLYSRPRKLFAVRDNKVKGRWDLRVNLQMKEGKTKLVPYAWLVSCALLKAAHDVRGRKCAEHYVDPKDWEFYHGDHWPIPDQCDCRLANLRPLEITRHQSEERFEWQRKTLPAAQRGLKRPASELVEAATKARAKEEAKAKARAKRTRSWQSRTLS